MRGAAGNFLDSVAMSRPRLRCARWCAASGRGAYCRPMGPKSCQFNSALEPACVAMFHTARTVTSLVLPQRPPRAAGDRLEGTESRVIRRTRAHGWRKGLFSKSPGAIFESFTR